MRKILMMALAIVTLTACDRVNIAEGEGDATEEVARKNVQFVMKGLSVDYVTRATVQSEGMTDLWIFEGETLLKHQVSTDADFGMPTVTLTYGSHDLTFIASKAEGQAFGTFWNFTRALETYGVAMNVTVSKGSATSRLVELKRVNSKVQWTVEDYIPATAKWVDVSVLTYFGIDASLSGYSIGTQQRRMDVSSRCGMKDVIISCVVIPAVYGEENDCVATITFKDAQEHTLAEYSHTVKVKANRITNIHGSFFGNGDKQSVSLLTDWEAQKDVDL